MMQYPNTPQEAKRRMEKALDDATASLGVVPGTVPGLLTLVADTASRPY